MIVCPRCHALIQPVAVHGHYQCQICKSNIDDCCSGEVCQPINISQEEDEDKMTTYKSPWVNCRWSIVGNDLVIYTLTPNFIPFIASLLASKDA